MRIRRNVEKAADKRVAGRERGYIYIYKEWGKLSERNGKSEFALIKGFSDLIL